MKSSFAAHCYTAVLKLKINIAKHTNKKWTKW